MKNTYKNSITRNTYSLASPSASYAELSSSDASTDGRWQAHAVISPTQIGTHDTEAAAGAALVAYLRKLADVVEADTKEVADAPDNGALVVALTGSRTEQMVVNFGAHVVEGMAGIARPAPVYDASTPVSGSTTPHTAPVVDANAPGGAPPVVSVSLGRDNEGIVGDGFRP